MSDHESSSDESVDVKELQALREMEAESQAKRNPAAKRREGINNVVGLRQKLKEIELPVEFAWVERCAYTSSQPLEEVLEDEHDDLAREAAFFKSTLSAVKSAVVHLDQSGIPYRRPRDFYAEMVKTDAHMARVKQVLLGERRRMDAVTERKKQRDLKKYAKKTQAASLAEKARHKREMNEAVTKWRKNKAGPDRLGAGDLEDAIMGKKHSGQKRGRSEGPAHGGRNKKRLAKDAKFGTKYGGKRSKSNDGKSVGDMSGFRSGRNRSGQFAEGAPKKSGKAPAKRPGKAQRMQSRGRR